MKFIDLEKNIFIRKKKFFESQVLQKRLTTVNELLESIVSLLAHYLHLAYLDIAGIQRLFPLLLQSRANCHSGRSSSTYVLK